MGVFMNSKLLLCSMVLTNQLAMGMSQKEFCVQKIKTNSTRNLSYGEKFLTDEISEVIKIYKGNTFEEKLVKYKILMKLIKANKDDYTYSGSGSLKFEALFEVIVSPGYEEVESWQVNPWLYDSTFYIKSLGSKKYKIYDCDSTRVCEEERPTREFIINKNELIFQGEAGDTIFQYLTKLKKSND